MNRREFCLGGASLLTGCGSGDDMGREYELQPSPIGTRHLVNSPVPGYGLDYYGSVRLVEPTLGATATKLIKLQVGDLIYESGTWVPDLGGSATYTTRSGRWVRTADAVCFSGAILVNLIGTGSTTQITGLPYQANGSAPTPSVHIQDFASLASNVVFIAGTISLSSTTILLNSTTVAAASTGSNAIFGNGTSLRFAGWYQL